MPIAKVKLPDGRIAKFDVPEGTSQEEVLAFANKRLTPQKETNQNNIAQDALSGLAQDLLRRSPQIKDILQGRGGTSLPEQGLQLGAQGLGAAGDVLGNLLIEPAAKIAGKMPIIGTDQTYGSALGNIFESLSNIPIGNNQTLGGLTQDLASKTIGAYQGFAQDNPRIARNVEAAGVVGTTLSPSGQAIKQASRKANDFAELGLSLKNKSLGLIPEARNVTADQLKEASQKAYELVDSLGATVRPELITDIRKNLDEKFTPKSEQQAAIFRNITPEGQSQVQSVRKTVSELEEMGQGLSLQDFVVLDKQITDILKDKNLQKDTGGFNAAGTAIKGIQEDVRDKVLNAGNDFIEGTPEGFEAYKKARDLYARQSRLNDLDIAIETASMRKNSKTALQTHFINLNKKIKEGKVKGYTEQEKKLIKQAAEQGNMTPILDMVGSYLPSIVSLGAGNPVLAGGLRLGSQGAREVANQRMLSKTDQIAQEIARNALPPQKYNYYDPALGRAGAALGSLVQSSGQAAESILSIPKIGQLGSINALGNIQQKKQQGVQ